MIRVVKKKSYSKRKTEDYIFKRKLKFAFSRFLKILQIFSVIGLIALMVWVFGYGGGTKIEDYTYDKATKFFISLGLKIESVEINGNKIVPTNIILDKIFASLGDVTTKSIILLDLEKLKTDLTSIGWIESVNIKKKLPGKLIITITERAPKILWQNKGQIWLADESGNLLTQTLDKKYIYLPVIIGQDPKKDIPEFYEIIRSSARLLKLVGGASKVGGRRWDISMTNNIKIKLPEQNPIGAWKKLEDLEKQNALFTKRINYIDMRIEGQLTTGLEQEQKNEVMESKKQLEQTKQ